MKKFFTLFVAALVAMSASAFDLSNLKKLQAPKNLKAEKFILPGSPVRKAAAAWENTPAPFAPLYNSTGFAYDFDAPEEEDPWYETDPWQTWAEEYVYEGDGQTYYGLVNVIPNEDMWVEDPVIDYYYNAEEGAVVVPCTPLAYYDEETIIYIMDIYDFGQGETGDMYFTLDKDGNFAREADCFNHAVAWTVAYFDEETYEPIDILGYFGVYAAMSYKPADVALQNTEAAVKATKAVVNGQVVIRRGDKQFNVMGAEL